MTEAKARLIDATKTTGEIVLEQVINGQFQNILEALQDKQTNVQLQIMQAQSRETIAKVLNQVKETEKDTVLSWSELAVIHAVINGEQKQLSGPKMKKMAFNNGYIETRKRRKDEVNALRGLLITCTPALLQYARGYKHEG